jgi:hypothetical protein
MPAETRRQDETSGTPRAVAPTFHASSIQVSWIGNDAMLIFQRPQPVIVPPRGEVAAFTQNEVTAVVYLSAATMKDLSVVLADQIAQVEAKSGKPIETEFTRKFSKNS